MTTSSAAVGCIATQLSRSAFVAPCRAQTAAHSLGRQTHRDTGVKGHTHTDRERQRQTDRRYRYRKREIDSSKPAAARVGV